jgi:hypothetical protein
VPKAHSIIKYIPVSGFGPISYSYTIHSNSTATAAPAVRPPSHHITNHNRLKGMGLVLGVSRKLSRNLRQSCNALFLLLSCQYSALVLGGRRGQGQGQGWWSKYRRMSRSYRIREERTSSILRLPSQFLGEIHIVKSTKYQNQYQPNTKTNTNQIKTYCSTVFPFFSSPRLVRKSLRYALLVFLVLQSTYLCRYRFLCMDMEGILD